MRKPVHQAVKKRFADSQEPSQTHVLRQGVRAGTHASADGDPDDARSSNVCDLAQNLERELLN